MNEEHLKAIIDFLKETDIEEFHWEKGDIRIFLRKEPTVTSLTDKVTGENESNRGVSTESEKDAKIPSLEPDRKKEIRAIKSPMVGTFYRATSPDHPPLVMEGNHVVPGQKVGIIEAMKIMKDVVSDVKGKIVKILVEDGRPVEYGQEIFWVNPEG